MWPYLEIRALQMQLVKMKSYWSRASLKDGCVTTEIHRESATWRQRQRIMLLWAKEQQRQLARDPKVGRGKEGGPYRLQMEHRPVNTLIWPFGLQNCASTHFCFKPLSWSYIVNSSHRKLREWAWIWDSQRLSFLLVTRTKGPIYIKRLVKP